MSLSAEDFDVVQAALTSLDGGRATGKGELRFLLEPVRFEREKLGLAKWLLLGLAILFGLSAAADLFVGDQGKTVFEACKTIFPPIATLVIGYYFSEKSAGRESESKGLRKLPKRGKAPATAG